jgi:hypothetical protein
MSVVVVVVAVECLFQSFGDKLVVALDLVVTGAHWQVFPTRKTMFARAERMAPKNDKFVNTQTLPRTVCVVEGRRRLISHRETQESKTP